MERFGTMYPRRLDKGAYSVPGALPLSQPEGNTLAIWKPLCQRVLRLDYFVTGLTGQLVGHIVGQLQQDQLEVDPDGSWRLGLLAQNNDTGPFQTNVCGYYPILTLAT